MSRVRLVRLEAAAHLEAVELRHHHVEQDQVGPFLGRDLQRGEAVVRGEDIEVFGRKLRVEQTHIHFDVVDDENAGRHIGLS